jgi:hypothetical protein
MDAERKEETQENELNSKLGNRLHDAWEESNIFEKITAILIIPESLLTIFSLMLPDVVELIPLQIRVGFYLVVIISVLYISFHLSFLLTKKKVLKTVKQLFLLLSIAYIVGSFIPQPWIIRNWKNAFSSMKTISVDVTSTPTPNSSVTNSFTSSPTLTPSVTITPSPSATLTATPLPPNSSIHIGVFDLGEGCIDYSIVEYLRGFNFSVELIDINNETVYEENRFEVLYLAEGWFCKVSDIENNKQNFKNFLRNPNSGLFIGNPEVTKENYTLDFFEFDIKYIYITEEEIYDLHPSYISLTSASELYDTLLKDSVSDMIPGPQVGLAIEPPTSENIYNYVILTRSQGGTYPSLVSSYPTRSERFIVFTGSELQNIDDSDFTYFFERMMKWLAHKPLNN